MSSSYSSKRIGKEVQITLKIDMSKAYEKVECCFLLCFMLCIGFSVIWVNLVMSCVELISYSVLVNGLPIIGFTLLEAFVKGPFVHFPFSYLRRRDVIVTP